MKKPIYKRSKNVWSNEQEAKNDICTKQNVQPHTLAPAHTATYFVFIQTPGAAAPTNVFRTSKENSTETAATNAAMMHLETFEGNLKADHTETEYVYSKVRE
jgi:hypothetical protein